MPISKIPVVHRKVQHIQCQDVYVLLINNYWSVLRLSVFLVYDKPFVMYLSVASAELPPHSCQCQQTSQYRCFSLTYPTNEIMAITGASGECVSLPASNVYRPVSGAASIVRWQYHSSHYRHNNHLLPEEKRLRHGGKMYKYSLSINTTFSLDTETLFTKLQYVHRQHFVWEQKAGKNLRCLSLMSVNSLLL